MVCYVFTNFVKVVFLNQLYIHLLFRYLNISNLPIVRHTLIIASFLSLISCRTTRPLNFLDSTKVDTVIDKHLTSPRELIITKQDVLGITVSSLNKELDAKFNTMFTPSTAITGSLTQDPGYPVDEDGNIQIHYLGRIKAENLTRSQLKELLEDKLSPFLKEPIIQIKFLNKKVTILGAVGKPQIIYLPDECIPLVDAMVLAGDLTQNAKPEEVYIIRDSSDKRKIKKVNLSNPNFMNGSWGMLIPNDIVYINKDIPSELKEEKLRRIQLNVSIVTSLVSIVVLLITVLKR